QALREVERIVGRDRPVELDLNVFLPFDANRRFADHAARFVAEKLGELSVALGVPRDLGGARFPALAPHRSSFAPSGFIRPPNRMANSLRRRARWTLSAETAGQQEAE